MNNSRRDKISALVAEEVVAIILVSSIKESSLFSSRIQTVASSLPIIRVANRFLAEVLVLH